jgi:Ser/Thr protein kinase RdoA (MazF antagonist)
MADLKGLWGQETRHFHLLTPDHVMHAAEAFGKRLSGRVMALNSLENRVYDVELASPMDVEKGFSSTNVILKFYRPGRWSEAQILEEHRFLTTLTEFEVPVVPPLEFKGKTLHLHPETNLWFALFPKVQGRLKDELLKDELEQVGRLIGRIHNIGAMNSFSHRLALTPATFIEANREALISSKPVDHMSFNHYVKMLESLYQMLIPLFSHLTVQRLHGDFHRGNIVWTSAGPMAVDFDDCLTGPVEQDLWLLFPGRDEHSLSDKERFISAYKEMTRKDHLNMNLTEALRTMRMVHFNAWIAKRWDDHSFQRVFPQFNSANYWDQELIDLRVQMGVLQDIGTGFEHY